MWMGPEYIRVNTVCGDTMEIYVVQRGDTVSSIASRFLVSEVSIETDNQLEYPYALVPGQALLINNGLGNRNAVLRSSGYVYPYILPETFRLTLPYLSSFSLFSYGFDEDGTLISPAGEDGELIIEGLRQATAAALTLAPVTEEQTFDNNLISALLADTNAQETLFENLIQEMRTKGYSGLNVDFEYVKAEDREAYSAFVSELTQFMRTYGYQVSVALAPKTSAEQQGVLYEGIDYRALGAAADTVILMTYEWGYTYGPPMAVAPLDKVREVAEYALTEIPAEKIMMGIPNYGYDWPLPYQAGETRAESISNVEAVRRAVRYGSEIFYDEKAQTPYFTYRENGVEHVVWFEDVRSLQAKFDLIKSMGLRGATYWQLMEWFYANWLLLEDNFFIIPGF